jgi:hypothetical protein
MIVLIQSINYYYQYYPSDDIDKIWYVIWRYKTTEKTKSNLTKKIIKGKEYYKISHDSS